MEDIKKNYSRRDRTDYMKEYDKKRNSTEEIKTYMK